MTREEYGFELFSGGLVKFDGVMCDGKPIKQIIVDRTNGTATAEYEDGSRYTVTASVTESNGMVTVSNITDTWERGTS